MFAYSYPFATPRLVSCSFHPLLSAVQSLQVNLATISYSGNVSLADAFQIRSGVKAE